ncbi:MAG: hypothetical protein M3A44_03670 [Gammaproteobacteria bacterium]
MSTIEQQDIWIKGNEGPPCEGVFSSTAYDQRDRMVRAAKAWGISWALSALSLVTFIPVVHVLAAVGFFIAGPVTAYSRYRTLSTANNATGTCPVCQQVITIAVQAADKLPLWTYCPSCSAPIHLVSKSKEV